MTTATYADSCRIEASSWPALASWLELQSDSGRCILTTPGKGIRHDIQRLIGDGAFESNGELVSVEFKVESRFTGNLFLETWSNRSRFKLGWLYTCQSDLLAFYFRDAADLYAMRTHALKAWVFGTDEERHRGNRHQLKEVKQRKTEQRNDTWGLLCPVYMLTNRYEGITHHRWCLERDGWKREETT